MSTITGTVTLDLNDRTVVDDDGYNWEDTTELRVSGTRRGVFKLTLSETIPAALDVSGATLNLTVSSLFSSAPRVGRLRIASAFPTSDSAAFLSSHWSTEYVDFTAPTSVGGDVDVDVSTLLEALQASGDITGSVTFRVEWVSGGLFNLAAREHATYDSPALSVATSTAPSITFVKPTASQAVTTVTDDDVNVDAAAATGRSMAALVGTLTGPGGLNRSLSAGSDKTDLSGFSYYGDTGAYTLSVTATDDQSDATTEQVAFTVSRDSDLSISGVTEGEEVTFGDAVSISALTTETAANVATLTIRIWNVVNGFVDSIVSGYETTGSNIDNATISISGGGLPVGDYLAQAYISHGGTGKDMGYAFSVVAAAPPAPTVTSQVTGDRTPIITGTFDASETGSLTVVVDETTYTLGGYGNLTVSGDTWTLDLSALSPPLEPGTYPVTATATNPAGSTSDSTTDELVIIEAPPAPTVTSQTTGDTTPVIAGTFDASETTTLTVLLGGVDYVMGIDAELTASGDTWTLDISAIDPSLDAGTYNVTATATNAAGATSDATSGELIIVNAPTAPTVVSQTTADTTPIITGIYTASETTTLTVAVDGTTYTLGTDSELTASGNNWTLDLSSLDPALTVGTYDVTATATNAGGSNSDVTSGELVIAADLTPVVTLTDPDDEGQREVDYAITLEAAVAIATGGAAIESVVFSVDDVELPAATLSGAKYVRIWTPETTGTKTLDVLVTDANDLTAAASVDFTVVATNAGPTLAIASPALDASVAVDSQTTISTTASDVDGIDTVTVSAGGRALAVTDAGSNSYTADWTPTVPGPTTIRLEATDILQNPSDLTRDVFVIGQASDGSAFATAVAGERGYFTNSTQSRTDNVIQTGHDRTAYLRFVDIGPAHGRDVTRAILELDTATSSGVIVEAIAVDEPASVSTYADLTGRTRVSLAIAAGVKSIDITDLIRGLVASGTRTADADVLLLLQSTDSGDAVVTHGSQRLLVWSETATATITPDATALWVGTAPVVAWQASGTIAEDPQPGWQLGVVLDGQRFYATADVGESRASIASRLANAIQSRATETGVTATSTGSDILLTASDGHRHTAVADFASGPLLTTLRSGQTEIPQTQEFALPRSRSGQFTVTVTGDGLEDASAVVLASDSPAELAAIIANLAETIEAGIEVTAAGKTLGVSATDVSQERIQIDITGLTQTLAITIDDDLLEPSTATTATTVAHTRAANALHQLAADSDAGGTATLTIDDVDVIIRADDGLGLADQLVNAGVPDGDWASVSGAAGLVVIEWAGEPIGRPVAASVDGLFEAPDKTPVVLTLIQRGSGPNYLDEPLNYADGQPLAPGRLLVFEDATTGPTAGLSLFATATSDGSGEIAATLDYARNQRVNVWAKAGQTLPSGLDAGTIYVIADDDRTDNGFRLETVGGAPVTPDAGSFEIGPKLAGLDLKSTFGGELGRSRRNSDGGWFEGQRYARLAFADDAEVVIGEGAGRGSELIRIDTGDFDGKIEILLSGNGAEDGRPAVCLLGDGGATLELQEAIVGVAEWPDEAATFGTVLQTGGTLHLGPGGTIAGGRLKQGGVHLEGTVATNDFKIRP